MVRGYCAHFGIKLADEELERERWNGRPPWLTPGRVAWQFTQELAGRLVWAEVVLVLRGDPASIDLRQKRNFQDE